MAVRCFYLLKMSSLYGDPWWFMSSQEDIVLEYSKGAVKNLVTLESIW